MSFFKLAILTFFFQKRKFLFHLKENKQPIHMRYHFFLHYGWFLQNFGREAVQTNMLTTVPFTNRCRWQNFRPRLLRLVDGLYTVIKKTQKTRTKVLPSAMVGAILSGYNLDEIRIM